MWRQILGISSWNCLMMLIFFIFGPMILGLDYKYTDSPKDTTDGGYAKAEMFTYIFNIFVFMQLGNEVNCRLIGPKDLNVFMIHKNVYFMAVLVGIFLI